MNVTIRECVEGGRVWTHRARTDDEPTAISRAVVKHWSRLAQFRPDPGLAGYGQVMRWLPERAMFVSETGHVRITVT